MVASLKILPTGNNLNSVGKQNEASNELQCTQRIGLECNLALHMVNRNAKMKIVDEFTAATGYHRKYAILSLRQFKPKEAPKVLPKKPVRNVKYNDEVQKALIQIWEAANRNCSKRLVLYLPELFEVMTRHGNLKLSPEVRSRLLKISPATVDRILVKSRNSESIRGLSTTRSGCLLKRQIPIRTFFRLERYRTRLYRSCPGSFSARRSKEVMYIRLS